MTNPISSQLALINASIAEKDSLIQEKDELVTSKDKLWRELHLMLREKDREIENISQKRDNLATENTELKNKCRRLQEALREILDVGKDDHDSEDDEDVIKAEMDGEAGAMHISRAPKNLNPTEFTFAPLINVTHEGDHEFGEMESVAAPVIKSVGSTIEEIDSRHWQGKLPAHPSPQFRSTCCAWTWLTSANAHARWTIECPRRFACHSCFRSKRTSSLWLRNMKWMLLPLPPQIRDNRATWNDAAYYIHDGLATTFSGVWEAARSRRTGEIAA